VKEKKTDAAPLSPNPVVLIVDDNHQLLQFLQSELAQAGWEMLAAETAQQAHEMFDSRRPNTVLLDYMLGDDDGLKLGLQLQEQAPDTRFIIMTGGELSTDEEAICRERDFPILHKPFLVNDILHLIGYRVFSSATASTS
jgi:two-component system phosphate regulon response regulator PhoB